MLALWWKCWQPQSFAGRNGTAVIKLEDKWKYCASSLWSRSEFRSERNKSSISSGLEERLSNIWVLSWFEFNCLDIFPSHLILFFIFLISKIFICVYANNKNTKATLQATYLKEKHKHINIAFFIFWGASRLIYIIVHLYSANIINMGFRTRKLE